MRRITAGIIRDPLLAIPIILIYLVFVGIWVNLIEAVHKNIVRSRGRGFTPLPNILYECAGFLFLCFAVLPTASSAYSWFGK